MSVQLDDNVLDDIMDKNVEELKKMIIAKPEKSENELYNEWRYSNLRITRLERIFFELYANQIHDTNKTKCLRLIINR